MVCNHKSANRVRPGKSLGIFTRLWVNINARVPLGYEDQTGFQFGIENISLSLEQSGPSKSDEDRKDAET
jgi:hypothetical protein